MWLRCWCSFECGRGRTQNYVGSKKTALTWSASWSAKVGLGERGAANAS